MSRIKEGLIGYEYKDDVNAWYEPTAQDMVDELVEYQVYCMSLSELTQRVTRQVRDEYYAQDINVMREQYMLAFGSAGEIG